MTLEKLQVEDFGEKIRLTLQVECKPTWSLSEIYITSIFWILEYQVEEEEEEEEVDYYKKNLSQEIEREQSSSLLQVCGCMVELAIQLPKVPPH